jgi:hypothetical protein
MKDTSDIVACVADHGLFVHVARRLAREFKKVYYFSPIERSFPTVRDLYGDGFENVTPVDSIWQVKSKCDLFVFPDIGFADEQTELISQGYPVWGARYADSLESDRGKFLKVLAGTGLPVPEYQVIHGLTALREHLRPIEDRYVKISRYRGDFETFHYRDWRQDESTLDIFAVRFGPWKEKIDFYVFEPIDTEIEDGIDTYCVDGQWPEMVIHGVEAKDKAYMGSFQKLSDTPEEVRCVNEAFGPVFGSYGYRSFFSTEVRITKNKESYFIDPTCRFGSPPSQVMCEMIGNLGEIMWMGANGILVKPKPAAQFGVQALVPIDRSDWAVMDILDELDQWFKVGYCSKIDGRVCVPPDENGPSEIGWLVGIGDTPKEAIEHLRENVELLPDGLHCEFHALADLLKEAEVAEEAGMPLSDVPMPKPESVIADE